jgi:hypothetical protein
MTQQRVRSSSQITPYNSNSGVTICASYQVPGCENRCVDHLQNDFSVLVFSGDNYPTVASYEEKLVTDLKLQPLILICHILEVFP